MNVLLVDDHKLFREGMTYVLRANLMDNGKGADAALSYPNQVAVKSLAIYEACDIESGLALATEHPELDLVLLDLNLPDCHGMSGLESFTSRFPALPVVVLSASKHHSDIRRSLDSGAMGFIPKDSSSSVVIEALRQVQRGSFYVPPAFRENQKAEAEGDLPKLTARQREVIQFIAEGRSNKEIARQLGLAETTIKMHMTHIMRLLKVANRTQAVVKAEKLGWIDEY